MIKQFSNWLDRNTTRFRNGGKYNQQGLERLIDLLEAKEHSLILQLEEETDPQRRKRLNTELKVAQCQRKKGLRLLNQQS